MSSRVVVVFFVVMWFCVVGAYYNYYMRTHTHTTTTQDTHISYIRVVFPLIRVLHSSIFFVEETPPPGSVRGHSNQSNVTGQKICQTWTYIKYFEKGATWYGPLLVMFATNY